MKPVDAGRPSRTPPRLAEVVATERISANFIRITFGGEALHGFPEGFEGANVKLLLPHADQSRSHYLDSLSGNGRKPVKRTYTVGKFDAESGCLEIDFALHDNAGPATLWACSAQLGDRLAIAGPGRLKTINPSADWFLLAGDMSAVPALLAHIKRLPATATGQIIIEVSDVEDQRELSQPPGMQVTWLNHSSADTKGSAWGDVCKAIKWRDGIPSIWIAGESGVVKHLRSWIAHDRGARPEHRYTSGYWQVGLSEDAFQPVKRALETDL